MNKTTKKPKRKYKVKLHAKVDKETDEKIRKIAEQTDFTISYILNELLKMSLKTGLAKDIFYLYMKSHDDPFLETSMIEGNDNTFLLREAFKIIESVFTEQENRIKELEKNHSKFVRDVVNGKVKQYSLTHYLPMDTEICPICKLEKPLNEFSKNKDVKTGFQYECLGCYKERTLKGRKTTDFQRKTKDK